MKTGVHANSIASYYGQQPMLSRRAQAVLDWLREHGPATDRQVMAGLGFSDMNAVRPRITELMEAGLVVELKSVTCMTTGKTVRVVDVPRQAQRELFS